MDENEGNILSDRPLMNATERVAFPTSSWRTNSGQDVLTPYGKERLRVCELIIEPIKNGFLIRRNGEMIYCQSIANIKETLNKMVDEVYKKELLSEGENL